ncbi:MAG: SCO family protein [Melioribacteraceae bacterium]|nr:SCO family protein [Melioribacteraceae bacterium]
MNLIRKINLILLIVITFAFYLIDINAQKNIDVGIDEKLGAYLPLELKFTNSEGEEIVLKDIIDRPVLLALVYYECPGICSPLLNELSWTIDKVQLEPGEDFRVIAVSFDNRETPEIAAKWKRNYLQTLKRPFDPSDWIFLTGDSVNIHRLTDAAGFYYKKSSDDQYIHAGTILTIAPDGKISRYLFGTSFNPFDVKMALIDAKAGKTNPTISKVLQFCFSYDPEGRQYTLNVTRIIGSIMLLGVGLFLIVLLKKKKNKN